MSERKMVVGLGNPGAEYANTRHNVGFRVIDLLAETFKIDVEKKKFGAVLGTGRLGDKKLILLKPWEFMNRSGVAVAKAVHFYRLERTDLLVVTDDMALPPGKVRIRTRGSSGGHKGLADVLEKLGTEEVERLRIGVGQSNRNNAVDFVLDSPNEQEKPLVEEAISTAKDAVLCWLEDGIEAAMNRFN